MKSLKNVFSALMIITSIAFAPLSPAQQTQQAGIKGKILVLGDSISAGLGVTPERAWVKQFTQVMHDKYRLQVINASVSGETSVGGKHRLPALLKTHQPHYVLIELGGNDGLRGFSTQTLTNNLQELITQSRAAGAKVVLVGMRIPTSYGARYTEEFAAIYPQLARRNGIPLVPFLLDQVALDPRLMQADKIHPNDQGQAQLLANVMAVFEPYLKQQTKTNK